MLKVICSKPECQTTAGCLCQTQFTFRSLSQYTDEEIAREYHWRMMKKLGDPLICVQMLAR